MFLLYNLLYSPELTASFFHLFSFLCTYHKFFPVSNSPPIKFSSHPHKKSTGPLTHGALAPWSLYAPTPKWTNNILTCSTISFLFFYFSLVLGNECRVSCLLSHTPSPFVFILFFEIDFATTFAQASLEFELLNPPAYTSRVAWITYVHHHTQLTAPVFLCWYIQSVFSMERIWMRKMYES
jgi:hypothetical protein